MIVDLPHSRRLLARAALGICGLAWLHTGCRKADVEAQPPALSRGDRAVVEAEAGEFYEGRVLSVDGQKVKLQTATNDDLIVVALGDVYRVAAEDFELRVGSFAICNPAGNSWTACQVEAFETSKFHVVDIAGERYPLSRGQLLKPTDVTQLNLQRLFEQAKARGEFEFAAEAAGEPRRPLGWRPAERERVLLKRDNEWYSARVRDLADGGVLVSVQEAEPMTVPDRRVAPEPPYSAAELLTAGSFALMSPKASTEPWIRVRLELITAAEALVVDRDGRKARVPLRRLVPLSR